MTDYKITDDLEGRFYVRRSMETMGGPYNTEEKAKRRIRDLKRKDLQPGHNTPSPPVAILDTQLDGVREEMARDDDMNFEAAQHCEQPSDLPTASATVPSDPIDEGVIRAPKMHVEHVFLPHGNPFDNSCLPIAIIPRANGYRPAHRANRFRSLR